MKPKIAVFAGPTATILNTPPLVTSNKARRMHALPPLRASDGSQRRYDALRPQRLAAPTTVFVEQLSAHPLEHDSVASNAPPDGYIDPDGTFRQERTGSEDVPVFRVELRPEDGLYLLPYMGRRANGEPFDPPADGEETMGGLRQTFLPDASRLYEEIDRFAIDEETGVAGTLSERADYDFYRAVPSAGYTAGLKAAARTDIGEGDVAPESIGVDFFPYRPQTLRADPPKQWLATAANVVQAALATGRYAGAQWLDGTPTIDEALYWLGLLVDTHLPIVGHSSQRMAQCVSFDGAQNIRDGVSYILSRCWEDVAGNDQVGPVLIVDGLTYAARDVTKVAARPGGYSVTGGLGGVVADLAQPMRISYLPQRRVTARSAVRITRLPMQHGTGETLVRITHDGLLIRESIPTVELFVYTRYRSAGDAESYIAMWLAEARRGSRLAGIVFEGLAPYGSPPREIERVLEDAALAGIPAVLCGRGNTGGRAGHRNPLLIRGDNLTGPKARILLTAALLRLGPLADPEPNDSPDRIARTLHAVSAYQELFDSH